MPGRAMAPVGRELPLNPGPSAAAAAKIRPIPLGGIIPSPFVGERRQAGVLKRFVADRRPEFQQRGAPAPALP